MFSCTEYFCVVWSPKRWAHCLRTWQLSVLRLFYHSKRMKFIAGKTSTRNVPTFSIFNTHTDSSFLCVYFGLNIFSAISKFFSSKFFLFSQTYWQLPRFCSIWHTEQGCHQLVLNVQYSWSLSKWALPGVFSVLVSFLNQIKRLVSPGKDSSSKFWKWEEYSLQTKLQKCKPSRVTLTLLLVIKRHATEWIINLTHKTLRKLSNRRTNLVARKVNGLLRVVISRPVRQLILGLVFQMPFSVVINNKWWW